MTEKQTLSLSPKYMTDSLAYWPLSRVVTHIKEREAESKDRRPDEAHLSTRFTVRFLMTVIERVAVGYNATPARMSKIVSYHAVEIMREDDNAKRLREAYLKALDTTLRDGGLAHDMLIRSNSGYSPVEVDTFSSPQSVYLYDPFIKSEFSDCARACGSDLGVTVMVYFMKSLLTDDMPYKPAEEVFNREVERWDGTMGFRTRYLEAICQK